MLKSAEEPGELTDFLDETVRYLTGVAWPTLADGGSGANQVVGRIGLTRETSTQIAPAGKWSMYW